MGRHYMTEAEMLEGRAAARPESHYEALHRLLGLPASATYREVREALERLVIRAVHAEKVLEPVRAECESLRADRDRWKALAESRAVVRDRASEFAGVLTVPPSPWSELPPGARVTIEIPRDPVNVAGTDDPPPGKARVP